VSQDPNDLARALWSGGRYEAVADRLRPASAELVAACAVRPGERALDVAAGSGNATIELAAAGAVVTASDLTPAMIALGSARTAALGLDLPWVEADAQALPFPDDSFDLAVSVFGSMFAPDPARVAAEMARVVRPGGRVGMAAWAPVGFNEALGRAIGAALDLPPDAPDPNAWGDEETARARFGTAGITIRTERRSLLWAFDSVEDFVRYLEDDVPPFAAARRALGDDYPSLRASLTEVVAAGNAASAGVGIDAPWLLILGDVP
jgi:SAM-dependent methyltransferase